VSVGASPSVPPSPSESAPGSGSVRWLARAGGANMFAAGLGSGAGVVLALALTHGFSRPVTGTFFATTAVFLIIETLASLGVTTGLTRILPERLARDGAEDCASVIRAALRPVLVVSLVLGGLMYLASPYIATHLVGSDNADAARSMLRMLSVFIPVAALNDSLLSATRGLHSMRPTVFVENLGRLMAQPVAVIVVAAMGLGPTALVFGWTAPYAVALAVNVVWAKSLLRKIGASDTALVFHGPSADAERHRELRSAFWDFTTPRAFATVIQTALKRSDVVMVAAMTTATQAAIYATATRFVTFGILGVAALQQALSPLVSKLLAGGNREMAETVYQTATVWMMCLAWPIYLLSACFSGPLLRIFGEGYQSGHAVVTILGLAMLFATACGPADSVLLMAGRSWLSLWNTSIALVLSIGLNFVLIPAGGITGAAITWAVATVVRNILPVLQLRHFERLRPESLVALRIGVLNLVLFGAIPLLAKATHLPLVSLALVGFVVAAGYLFLILGGRTGLMGAMSLSSALRRPPRQDAMA
jgi:O-antigen/teichoic acid export membrane protein